MKIDRLLAIVIFLLNHRQATARTLADAFEVSVRTIKRDMDTINQAGIPVRSTAGAGGGYAIEPRFALSKQYIKKTDVEAILTALTGLQSSFYRKRLEPLVERLTQLSKPSPPNSIFLDYSVAQEGRFVQVHLNQLAKAIADRHRVLLTYRNLKQEVSERQVRPLALTCQWGSWYLFAFCEKADDYRLFKLIRMKQIVVLGSVFPKIDGVEALMRQHLRSYSDGCIDIEILIHEQDRDLAEELFPNGQSSRQSENHWVMHLHLPAYERLWKAKLICLGDRVKIIRPDFLRTELTSLAKSFIAENNRKPADPGR
ncbi:MAG: YafY family transcriptional regulator [Sporolactobacillus sp.]|jgi:predicted DNA-binding transcriptional regulator YafY|nr:YafY family transcriptional regulator [Sporolactobacillus sp.]